MILNEGKAQIEEKDDNIIISNELAKKITSKKYSLHFLPERFEKLSKHKFVEFKGKKLKIDYLIDITNNLILKYYFKKENRFPLNAIVLKDKYGYLYNYYINYLIEINVLILKQNYKKGKNSRIYALDEKIFRQKIKRYKNSDSILLKKLKKRVFNTFDLTEDKTHLINNSIKQKLISDLFDVDIDLGRSIFFLDSLKDDDMDIYNRNLYSVDSIKHKHIFYHFDNYGRMHTNFTILRSFIRKNCLLIDGEETTEIDIGNSQPLFLTKIINDSESSWVIKEEFEMFKNLTKHSNYYKFLMNELGLKTKKEAKTLTYKVLFGKNAGRSKDDILFKSLFPSIHKFIVLYKKEHGDYKILSHNLQRMESNLIFNKIINKIITLYPDVKMITVHDSIVFQRKYNEEINNIFQSELLSEFNF